MISSFTFFNSFLIISRGFTFDLFYLSIFGNEPVINCNYFFFSSSILLILSNNVVNLLLRNFKLYYMVSTLLLFTFNIELFLMGPRLATDDLKLE